MTAEYWGSVRMFVILLLVLQLVTVVLLWLLNPVGTVSESRFALLLAADLVAFSMVSYIARHRVRGEDFGRNLALLGSVAVMSLVVLLLVIEVL